jgi:tRNA pseudouridine55 synthase
MTDGTVPEGLVIVDKPAGWTSHDVVGKLRRLAGTRRVGHAGTLDPAATGVLVCGLGRATRLLGHLAHTDKTYAATIRLGTRTTTDDAEGEILAEAPVAVDDADLGAALASLTGDIEQVPSSVSAIKVDGRRAYARVRAGEDVTLSPRPVRVSRLALRERRGNDLDVEVDCSSGTYIRALARDLGDRLGCGGHLATLRRTRVGSFGLSAAVPLEQLIEAGSLTGSVLSLADAVAGSFPRRDLDAEQARELSFGRGIPESGRDGPVGAFAPDGSVVALLEDREGRARSLVVFAPA